MAKKTSVGLRLAFGAIIAVWAVVAFLLLDGGDTGAATATFVLLLWYASTLGNRRLFLFLSIASLTVVSIRVMMLGALGINETVAIVVLLASASFNFLLPRLGTGSTPGGSTFTCQETASANDSVDHQDASRATELNPLSSLASFTDGSVDEGMETRDYSGVELYDSSLDSGIVAPELVSQNGNEMVERADASGAFEIAEIIALDRAVAKASTPVRALKALIRSGHLTKFQAMHLLWGQETQLRFGDYVLVEVIGRGASSTVYRGRHFVSGDSLAIKILHANEQAIKRVNRELQSVHKLAHPNIVVAFDSGKIHSRFFIAMELIRGSDLNRLVRESGPLDERMALVSILQIALGLQQAHDRGILHRDVKPGNMLLTSAGDVKLADLGLSCPMQRLKDSDSFETAQNSLGGTLEFMAPEQVSEFRDVDARADTFALGSSLFFLLTGRSRLPGKNLAERINNLTVHRKFLRTSDYIENAEVVELIDRLSAFDVNDRIGTVNEAIEKIRAAIAGLGEPHPSRLIRVLVVEDNQDDMYMTLRMLTKTNRAVETIEASTLSSAIAACDRAGQEPEFAFDIALLDANLPDSSGEETVRRFRQRAPDVAIIALSGRGDDEFKAMCLHAGADSYLSKNDLTTERMEREVFVTLARRRVANESHQGNGRPGNGPEADLVSSIH